MPKLHFCPAVVRGLGILLGALSREAGKDLLNHYPSSFRGEQFPSESTEPVGTADFALMPLSNEEADESWPVGFCRFDSNVMHIDEALQALPKEFKTPTL